MRSSTSKGTIHFWLRSPAQWHLLLKVANVWWRPASRYLWHLMLLWNWFHECPFSVETGDEISTRNKRGDCGNLRGMIIVDNSSGHRGIELHHFLGNFTESGFGCTVPVECKLTVPCISILTSRDSILDSQKFRESSIETSFKNFEDREWSFESKK